MNTFVHTIAYANTEPSDCPQTVPEMFFFLGIMVNQITDNLSLHAKPLIFRSRLKGPIDIICRNVKEFVNFMKTGKLLKAYIMSLVNSVYCPPLTLSITFVNVGKKVQQTVIDSKMTWASKIDPIHFPIIEKLGKLYLLIQNLTIP